jgi:hypothetical protein
MKDAPPEADGEVQDTALSRGHRLGGDPTVPSVMAAQCHSDCDIVRPETSWVVIRDAREMFFRNGLVQSDRMDALRHSEALDLIDEPGKSSRPESRQPFTQ